MKLAIKKDCDRVQLIHWLDNNGYSFRLENSGLFLFCSWINHSEIGIAEAEGRMVLWDHSIISCSDVFVRQSSQTKNLSSKTSPHWWSWRWNFCLHISHIFSEIVTPPKPHSIVWLWSQIFIQFKYKTLLDEKKKRERDGMQSEGESGRNASFCGLACPPYLIVN